MFIRLGHNISKTRVVRDCGKKLKQNWMSFRNTKDKVLE